MTDRVKTAAAGRDLCATPAERRDLLRLLRRLLRGPVEMGAGEGAALRVEGEDLSLAADLVARAVRHGLVAASGGTLSATPQTSAFLRRALLAGEEAFAGQHRVEVQETVDVEGERQAVRRNLAESPLSLLSRLKDRTGGAFLPIEAIEAGERLAADFTRAQLQPRVTASWEPRLSARGKGERGGQAELADSAMAARDRFAQAVEAMGPELSGVAIDLLLLQGPGDGGAGAAMAGALGKADAAHRTSCARPPLCAAPAPEPPGEPPLGCGRLPPADAPVGRCDQAAAFSRASSRMRLTIERRPLARCEDRCSTRPMRSKISIASVETISEACLPE